MGPALEMLQELGIKLASEAITREALIRELKQANISTVDASTGVPHMHASLTIFSPELTVFLGYQNRQLMSDLTDWYDCRDRWTYRTKGSGVDEIIGVWVNLFGGTTPELVQSSMPLEAIGGGLTSRILFVYGSGKAKKEPWPASNMELRTKLVQELEQIYMLAGEFKPNEECLAAYTNWYMTIGDDPMEDSRFGGYVERRANHVLKLSMIMSASRGRDMVITEADFARALDILYAAEKRMPQVFLGVGKNPHSDVVTRLAKSIAMGTKFTYGSLLARYLNDVSAYDFEGCVQSLVQTGVCRVGVEGGEKVIYNTMKGNPYED